MVSVGICAKNRIDGGDDLNSNREGGARWGIEHSNGVRGGGLQRCRSTMAMLTSSSSAVITGSLAVLILFVPSVMIVIRMSSSCARSGTIIGVTLLQRLAGYAGYVGSGVFVPFEVFTSASSSTAEEGRAVPPSLQPKRVLLLSKPCTDGFRRETSGPLSCAEEIGRDDLLRDGSNYSEDCCFVHGFTWSPKDESMFVLAADRVWLKRTDPEGGLISSANATLIAGPWLPPDNGSLDETTAITVYDPDLSADGSSSSTGKKVGRRVLFVGDNGNRMLRVYLVPALESADKLLDDYSLPYDDFTGGRQVWSLACDSLRHVLYATTDSQVLKMTLKGTVEFVEVGVVGGQASSVRLVPERARFESWIGSSLSVGYNDGGDDPRTVRFNGPIVSSSTISTDGEQLYVADVANDIIRRIWTVSGKVETIAGRAEEPGARDGTLLEARFKNPRGVVLMPDGCNMFTSEVGGGEIRLIHLDSVGEGSAAGSVSTIARVTSGSSVLARTSDGGPLYIGSFRETFFQLAVTESALPPCSSPIDASNSSVPAPSPRSNAGNSVTIIGVAVGLRLLVGAAAIAASCFVIVRRRRGGMQPGKVSKRFPSGAEGAELRVGGISPSAADTTPVTSLAEWSLSQPSVDRENPPSGGSAEVGGRELQPAGPRRYCLAELRTACDGFSQRRLLGQGGAAEVYKGVLSGGEVVAVKLMKGEEFSAGRFRQFQAELAVLGSLRHRHLCPIIGYCTESDRSSIVYPFVDGGTLYDRLHSPSSRHHPAVPTADGETQWIGKPTKSKSVDEEERSSNAAEEEGNSNTTGSLSGRAPLEWTDRVVVACHIASALHYLQELVDPPIVHRDVKSKNVLLGSSGNGRAVRAYLSDFGLAKLGQSVFGEETAGETVETYHVAGTMGYMAPEYFRDVRLTVKNDVYAFGVLLLELVSGRKPFGERSCHLGEEERKEKECGRAARLLLSG
ncbi:hypothetical protein CBR_g30196 [Chara braunii]|uniref:Protein kinase domain-containing protein n=1 Tax=Chara braunii TaxID=69332 RepID=A0A388LCM1_CHABU|nr:hypothetical protein CBR_g30196 [Chara braunii]|eukprot:GBG79932.1 hypothetical protein CBR_g30196 [Chara braunii]